MTLRIAFLVGALALGQPAAGEQQPAAKMDEPIVHVGLFTATGSATSTAETVGTLEAGVVYMAPCAALGAADASRPVSAAATDVWQISVRVQTMTPDEASAQVTWQRIRRGGLDEQSAPQSATLALKRGDRVSLEQITVPAAGSCRERAVALEVLYASRGDRHRAMMEAIKSDGTVATGGGARVFTNAAGEVNSVQIARAGETAPHALQAELWLVRSLPGEPDQTQHTTSAVTAIPREFSFAPITMPVSNGVISVQIKGTIETGFTPEGRQQLYFSANRTATLVPATQPARDSGATSEGSMKTAVPLPGPDQILAFELPPLQMAGGGTALGQLSIRLRLMPTPMREMPR
jgi:hypothetical protein